MSKKEKKNCFLVHILLSFIILDSFICIYYSWREEQIFNSGKITPWGSIFQIKTSRFYKQGEWNVAIFLGFISSITCKVSLTLMENFHWNICNPFENKITEKIHLRERNILGIVVSAYEINLL